MAPIGYKRVSGPFLDDLHEQVLQGESAVLLGARYSGKGYILHRLRQLLTREQVEPIVHLDSFRHTSVTTREQLAQAVNKAVGQRSETARGGAVSNEVFASLDRLHQSLERPVVLLVANVDQMAHNLARSFLQGVRTRVEAGSLIVVLSGEDNFRELVHGPNSEFTCAHAFAIQGFDLDEFGPLVKDYAERLCLSFTDPGNAYKVLLEQTGGNLLFLRVLLWNIAEYRLRDQIPPHVPISPEEVIRLSHLHSRAHVSHALYQARQVIASEAACWDRLERLLAGETVPAVEVGPAPGALELAGVAIRARDHLRFASPLMERFVRSHYTPRRLGDLHASVGQWDCAFHHYRKLTHEERMGPVGVESWAEMEGTVHSLNTSLHAAAAQSTGEVKKLFAQGCRYVLGFPDVSFWTSATTWHPQPLAEFQISPHLHDQVARALLTVGPASRAGQGRSGEPSRTGRSGEPSRSPQGPDGPRSPHKSFRLALEKRSPCALAALLPALRSDRHEAVVVGHLAEGTAISKQRERLARKVLNEFIAAYTHAVEVERARLRLEVRDKHVGIVNSIFEALGNQVTNASLALKMAARGLRGLGYRRVLFCLVDPEREWIHGVLDDSDDPSVNVAEHTHYRLDQPEVDLQPFVIISKKPLVISDAEHEPLANQEVVQLAHMKAEALVPILNRDEEAAGTIHVEREDGDTPSPEEVEDLMTFGRHLAVAIEQSERVHLLESALHKVPEPVLIVDTRHQARYANRPASDLLEVKAGWSGRNEAAPLGGTHTEVLHEDLRNCLSTPIDGGQRIVHRVEGVGCDPAYRGAVLAENIRNWNGQLIGALVHIQDQNYLHRMLEAFRTVAEANDTASAIQAMLKATELLGHRWGRLYLIDEGGPGVMVSKRSFGFDADHTTETFEAGKVRLERREEPGYESWTCIEQGQPLVFCYKPTRRSGLEFRTRHGLLVTNINPPQCPPEVRKEPGEYWIDFPLLAQDRPLGKLTLQCDKNLPAENFELLKALAEMTAGLLDAFLRRERWVRTASEHSMAIISHNLATRLAGLDVLLTRYQLASSWEKLQQLNEEFAHLVGETMTTIRRTKELLAAVTVRAARFDLMDMIRRGLSPGLPEGSWVVQGPEEGVEIEADQHLLSNALLEMVQNSCKAARSDSPLSISVAVAVCERGGREVVQLLYRDRGPGVPRHLRERIFEDFFTHWEGQKNGTGLGLAFVRRVANAHGGFVRYQGTEGKGAEFLLEIPRFVLPQPREEEDEPALTG
jgi:signal transduction histidine kinase/PAS domain-containing protein